MSLVLVLIACAPAQVDIVAVRDLGPLETTTAVRARDGGYSVPFDGKTVWLYGDTVLSVEGEDGSSWRHNTWSWTEDLDASDGLTGFTEPTDALGAPQELFPPTDAEAAYNESHREIDGSCAEEPCNAREALWPMAAVADPDRDRALLFYEKIHGEPGEWNFFARGFGVAVLDDLDAGPWRPEVAPGAEYPTLLFTGEDDNFGAAALVEGDWLYAWSCRQVLGADKPCRVARVDLDAVLDRSAWTFWDGAAWVDELDEAADVLDGASQMTVHWNAYLGQYLAVHMREPWDKLVVHTAPAPQGPWSEREVVAEALPAADGWAYCGVGHPELAREDGRFEYLSYYRSTGDWEGEIRLVEVELAAR